MPDELSPAVAILQRKLEEQMQAVSETKKVINMLLKSMGKPSQYADVAEGSGIIRADQFYGKPLATAAQKYLELRGQACQPDEILRGMLEGGFDFDVLGWKENDRLRSLAISLAKNNVKFHRLKNGSFGLREWYDEDFLTKERRAEAVPQTRKAKGKKKVASKITKTVKAQDAESQAKDEPQPLCSRGCGKAPHRGRCKPIANVTAITSKPNGSAKEKTCAEADQPTHKEAVS